MMHAWIARVTACSAVLLAGLAAGAEGVGTSTLIVNASIVDGTGAPARQGALRIDGDRIVEIGQLEPRGGERVVDANGLTLAPGFIDVHSHHDRELFDTPEAVPVVSQGITTIVVGQDGSMVLPPAELFARIEDSPLAINVATYVGHGSLRRIAMGEDFRRAATPGEIARMRGQLEAGMEAGALGLSTGLEYDPGIYSTTEEIIELAKAAKRQGGRYISHVRSEDRDFWAAIDEIIRIGREVGIPVQVTHMKLAMKDSWGQSQKLLDLLDAARAAGVDVTGDVYPYDAWNASPTVLFPRRDFTNRESAQFALDHIAPPEAIIVSLYSPEPALVGKTLTEIAGLKGMDPAAALMELIARASGPGDRASIIGRSMVEADIAKLIAWPHAAICSDGSMAGLHPRGRGAFPKVLRVYVREQKLLSLEQAVHKMTGLAAANVGVADRGVIRPGAFADLVLFDPEAVADRATFESPFETSVGIATVWVNGVPVWQDGQATDARPGRGIKRP